MYEFLLSILLLQWRLAVCLSSPTLEDNMLPTDEEVISDLINSYRRGQPEQEIALNLPTDEEAFNEIKPILQSGNPFYYINGGGHFISSSFPEIDARGFHESVFDDLDDFYPISQRGKKYDAPLTVSARGFYGDVFTDGFGNFHPVKRYYKNREDTLRRKRSYQLSASSETVPVSESAAAAAAVETSVRQLPPSNKSRRQTPNDCVALHCPSPSRGKAPATDQPLISSSVADALSQLKLSPNGTAQTSSVGRRKRSLSSATADGHPHDSGLMTATLMSAPSSSSAGCRLQQQNTETNRRPCENGENNRLHKLRKRSLGRHPNLAAKRVPEMAKSGFDGDVFHNQFGKFDTLKRDPSVLHGDVFHKSFGTFETLKKRKGRDDYDEDDRGGGGGGGGGGGARVSKRRPQLNGVNTDAFYSNFGNFETLKRSASTPVDDADADDYDGEIVDASDEDAFNYVARYPAVKRRPQASMLNGDAFHTNFGSFDTMKRTLAGDAFHSSFGTFDTMKRTLAGDAFHSNFGRFEPMKRTLAGDAFHSSFGAFEPMKRGRSALSSPFAQQAAAAAAFYPDFDAFDPTKRTLGGDAFHSQFGRFETMKRSADAGRRRLDASHGAATTGESSPVGDDGAFDSLRLGSSHVAPSAPMPAWKTTLRLGAKSAAKADESTAWWWRPDSRFARFVRNQLLAAKLDRLKNTPSRASINENVTTVDLARANTSSTRSRPK